MIGEQTSPRSADGPVNHARAGPIRVAVFDSRPVMAEGLAALLSDDDSIDVVSATTDLSQLIWAVVKSQASVVVFGTENAPQEHLRAFLTQCASDDSIAGRRLGLVAVTGPRAEAGEPLQKAFLPTPVAVAGSVADIKSSIVLAYGRAAPVRAPFPAAGRRGPSSAAPADILDRSRLTRRELEVLQRIEKGLSTKEIAAELGIRVNTVRTHVQRLMPKLGTHSRLEAAARVTSQRAPEGGMTR